ncbi:MAG: hypothetical protein K5873_09310 [Treponema sp.]|nr:hypothetical protein [Treponema sp.]
MAISSIRILQSNLSQNFTGSVLKSGTIVNGRVLSKNSNGSYIVSLAGQKITVQSQTNLIPGSLFSAKVNISNGQLQLSLIKENPADQALLQKFGSNGNLSPQLSEFLTSLGLEGNRESLRILQFMQQVGMKIDIPAARKALNQSRKNGKSDMERAELSLLLEEKGLPSDDEALSEIQGRNPGDNPRHKKNQDRQNQQNQKQNQNAGEGENPEKITSKDIKKYFEEVDSAASRKEGILAAFNTIKSSAGKRAPLKHWILLPFEWNFNNYWGNIRLLFDSDLKNLEKAIIDLKNEEKSSIFVLDYKNGSLSSVNFSSSQEFSSAVKRALTEKLSSMLNLPASYQSFDRLQGFCEGGEEVSFVRGMA